MLIEVDSGAGFYLLGGLLVRIKGFAMADGVSFTDGKQRFTGRRLPNGAIEIRQSGSWFWRFSLRQKIAISVLLVITCLDYGWEIFNDSWFTVFFLLLSPIALRLSASQKKYHGAEHMAVNLFEGRVASVYHPGCGSNLVLMLIPGLLLELLPWGLWITLLGEIIYLVLILKVVWPAFQIGFRQGRPLAQNWWRLGRRWQRLFVTQPNEDEFRLAVQTLNSLFEKNDTQ